jgi:hypothetical protein
MDRIELSKKPLWSHDVPTDAEEFYFVPRVYLMRTFTVSDNTKEARDIDMSLTPLYIAEGQQVTMRIVGGKLQIRVTNI